MDLSASFISQTSELQTFSANPQRSMLTPQDIASSEAISGLKLSPNASHVIYCVGPLYTSGPGDHRSSALWVAETLAERSAKQLTSGTARDYSPSFHPTTSDIYFLSDRHKRGGAAQIYRFPLTSSAIADADVSAVTPVNSSWAISSYSLSPDGNYVAFISTDQPSENSTASVQVWREKKRSSLRLLDLRSAAQTVRTLVDIDEHVESFSWSPDSTAIIYRVLSHSDFESRFFPVVETIVSVESGEKRSSYEYPRMPGSPTVWRPRDDLVFVQSLIPAHFSSSKSVWTRPSSGNSPSAHVSYGESDDANGIVDIGADSQFAVEVATGLDSRYDVFDSDFNVFSAFQTSEEAIAYMQWDMRQTEDGRYILVALRSSSGEPMNVWCGETVKGKLGKLTRQLSSHYSWLSRAKTPISKPFYWNSSDGVNLQGVLSYPQDVDLKGLPTVVVPHGGPYGRDMLELELEYWRWPFFLASQGYIVLAPNYRGSLGRGDSFAKAANGGMGTLDWEDVESMIDEAISQGLVDPNKLGLAGYSQGGFLTAWGCTRPNSRFKVGVIGAGVSDWGLLAATSDMPDMEAHLGGGAPWVPGEPIYLRGSPIKDVKNTETPLLLLHGQEDKRVPVTQAIALFRGLERESSASVKPKLVIYPREGHVFDERDHAQDVLQRLVDHLDLYLK